MAFEAVFFEENGPIYNIALSMVYARVKAFTS
jgi:hypothetical protein